MVPIYHLFLFAISGRDSATSGRLWPKEPTLQNFALVFGEKHFYLEHFWLQLWNSLLIAVAVAAITLFVAGFVPPADGALAIRVGGCRIGVHDSRGLLAGIGLVGLGIPQ